jgi:hypothetical protein
VHGCGDEVRSAARAATQEKARHMTNGVLLNDKDKRLRPDERKHLESKLHKAVEKKAEARTAKPPAKK